MLFPPFLFIFIFIFKLKLTILLFYHAHNTYMAVYKHISNINEMVQFTFSNFP